MPTQAPLPGNTDYSTNVYTIDIGQSLEQISIRGVVNTTSTGAGDPSKANLETVARTWWEYGDTPANLAVLQIVTGQSYRGHIKQLSFVQEGAKEDRWEFTLDFIVREKVT
jgi:hypothetical protein